MWKRALHLTYRTARRVVVLVVGVTVIAVGAAMIVLPGPAMLVIPLGLAILGLEFAWARRWLRKMRDKTRQVVDQVRGRPRSSGSEPPPDEGDPIEGKRVD